MKNRRESNHHALEETLNHLDGCARDNEKKVTLGQILESVGQKSFAPILLMLGLIATSPLSGIPGMPSALGLIVMLIAVQLLFRRDHFWLPQWILNRKVNHRALSKATRLLRKPARAIDRVIRPRLTFLTRNVGAFLILLVTVCIGATMPPLELIPFAATLAGLALTAFALSLIANDGLLAVIALAFTGSILVIAVTQIGS